MSRAKSTLPVQLTLDRDYLTVDQTASYFQVSSNTILKWIKDGALESFVILPGGVVRIPATSIRQLLGSSR